MDRAGNGERLPGAHGGLVEGFCAGEVLSKNFGGDAALSRHHGSAVLAKADAVARATTVEKKVVALGSDIEPRAEDVAPAERAANGEAEVFCGDLG